LNLLIARARLRALGNLILDQASVGAMAACGGALVLLLVGTQILDWYWPVALFVVGAGISAWRTLRFLPSQYAVAQRIDRELSLHDTLSTAWHFAQAGSARGVLEPILMKQRSAADEMAAGIDAAAALPLRIPRHFFPALAMAGVVLSLFVVRYGITGTLDLKAPLVEAVADFFAPNKQVAARNKKAGKLPGDDPLGIPVDRPGDKSGERDKTSEEAVFPVENPDINASADTKDSARTKQSEVKAAGDQAGDDLEGSEESERGKGENGQEGGSDSNKNGSPDAKEGSKNQGQRSGSENSSLMDKMKDAMANLMSKLKIPRQAGQQGKQSASNQKSGQKGGSQQEGMPGQKGEKGQGQQQGKGSPSDEADADQQQQGEQQAQAGQGRSNEKGQEGGSPNESKSGMGKQDGSKDIRDAEQQAAMGKISEIFGKRQQNITGEVMVEVTSGKQQQLRTAYTQSGAAHKEAGGEIHRDEVPQAFQHYVEQYFEQVRKGEAAGEKKK
jgi:hypothetical protein